MATTLDDVVNSIELMINQYNRSAKLEEKILGISIQHTRVIVRVVTSKIRFSDDGQSQLVSTTIP